MLKIQLDHRHRKTLQPIQQPTQIIYNEQSSVKRHRQVRGHRVTWKMSRRSRWKNSLKPIEKFVLTFKWIQSKSLKLSSEYNNNKYQNIILLNFLFHDDYFKLSFSWKDRVESFYLLISIISKFLFIIYSSFILKFIQRGPLLFFRFRSMGCKEAPPPCSVLAIDAPPPAPPDCPPQRLTRDQLLPPTPSVHLENKKHALCPQLQEFCLKHPIAVVRGIAAALKMGKLNLIYIYRYCLSTLMTIIQNKIDYRKFIVSIMSFILAEKISYIALWYSVSIDWSELSISHKTKNLKTRFNFSLYLVEIKIF